MKRKLLGILISVLLLSVCALSLTACGGSSSKMEKITFSSTKEEVKEILGEPYEAMGQGWVYYGKNLVKLKKQAESLQEEYAEATLNMDFEKMLSLEIEIDKLELKMLEIETEFTQIVFNENGTVEDLVYDKNMGALSNEKKATPETPATVTVVDSDDEMVWLSIKYKDGSYKLRKISASNIENKGTVYGTSNTDFLVLEFVDDWGSYMTSWYSDKLTKLVIPEGTTKIENDAFKNNTDLKEAVFPSSLIEIGSRAFDGCTSLSSISLPEGLEKIKSYAFRDTAITEIVIPDSATSIESSAFTNCVITKAKTPAKFIGAISKTNLQEIEITKGEINTKALYNSALLSKVVLGSDVTKIGDSAFSGCKNLLSVIGGDGVVNIGVNAFYGCKKLSSMPFGNQLLSIGNAAFSNCESITDINLPKDLNSIGNSAFSGCMITSLIIPNSVETIGDSAFRDCTALSSVTIGKGVKTFGDSAFSGCKNIKTTNYAGTIDEWVAINFNKGNNANPIYYSHNLYIDSVLVTTLNLTCEKISAYSFDTCHSITSVKIGANVREIGEGAFAHCQELQSLEILNGVTKIGTRAFSGCSNLTTVTIPDSVISLGAHAFYNCEDLVEASLGKGVEKINKETFFGCDSLKSVHLSEGLTAIDDGAFYGCGALSSVVIPNSVKSIGTRCFYYNSALKTVVIGEGVEVIGERAFEWCRLEEITIGSGVQKIEKDAFHSGDVNVVKYTGTVDQWASIEFANRISNPIYDSLSVPDAAKFYVGGALLTHVTISEVTHINNYAFYGCDSIVTLIIGDSVKTIGDYAFYRALSMISVEIGKNVERIGYAFSMCDKLVEIYNKSKLNIVAGSSENGNISYAAKNVYTPTVGSKKLTIDKDGYAIYEDVGHKTFVAYVGDKTEIVIPEGVTKIYKYALYENYDITDVTIPSSVVIIEDYALYYCLSLKKLSFGGTLDKWKSVTWGTGWVKEVPVSWIECSDGGRGSIR